ncbi:hypothetical protein [Pseudomonas prosekii]|uniref:Uncharacterized protein n=1 Tax=Pseudomonas prosekii TaxID=1148509 RepID=A0A1H2B1M1_9PSED|nr:hypothetical protein [Pseudomonas prosekii]SDT52074.1 hypothetical protein SAMN05216222_4857 [Pseudomonas prosekii]
MNAALIAQLNYENRQPPPVSESPREDARAEWLYNAAEDLLRGCGVSFQRRMHKPQGVTAEQFALAVDEHVNARLAGCEIHTSALGWLVITAGRGQVDKVAAAELLGDSDHPLGKLGEIAEVLLKPLANDALIAKAEDDEL